MAILSKIREKSVFLIFIIALGLFAFLVQPDQIIRLFQGGGSKDYVVKVADETIGAKEFATAVESRQRAGQSSLQIANQVYNQKVTEIVMQNEFDKLGITVEKDQMWELIKTAYKNYPDFKNEAGDFDEGLLKAYIENQVATNPRAWEANEKQIAFNGKQQLYYALIKSASLPTEKEGEIAYKMQNDLVDLKYVFFPYTSIVDSTVTISNAQIKNYISAHKNEFQSDASAAVQYVYFEEKPSKEDEDNFKVTINKLLPEFKTTSDVASFLSESSATAFDTIYKFKNALDKEVQNIVDSIALGTTVGPYTAGEFTKVSKLVATKMAPSVQASHALISYKGAQRVKPEVTRTKEEAQALANTLLAVAKQSGTDFAKFATKNSDGPSATKGGDLGWFYEGQMVPKFNEYVFNNRVGSIGLVETPFGFHIIKVVDTKEEKKYQVAALTLKNEASPKTISQLYADATQFEIDATSGKFEAVAETKNYNVRPVNKVTELSENLPGLKGTQRSIVKWMFNADTKLGNIKRFDVDGNYVVVRLTGRSPKGNSSVQEASFKVLPLLRNQEKAKQLRAKISATTLADIAANQKVTVRTANAVSMGSPMLPGAGSEPTVVGTAFALENGQISKLIDGTKGVFMVEVAKHTAAPKMDTYKSFAKDPANNVNAVGGKVVEALKKKANIEDNRATFY